MTTRSQARDVILTQFKTAWDLLSSPPKVLYDDVSDDIPPASSPWVRVTVQTYYGGQATLGSRGNRQFDHFGSVTVQVFTPIGDGMDLSDSLSQSALDIFEGESTGSIWFRNVRANDIGVEGDWYQVNVRADFEYVAVK